MAKRTTKGPAKANEAGGTTAVADEENGVPEAGAETRMGDRPHKDQKQASRERKRGFFDIYKPGQGYHTRVGTAMGVGSLTCWFAYFLFEKMALVSTDPRTAKLWQVGVAVAVIVLFGLLGYWLLGLSRKTCDFLIATEGEMKKVNWTNRKEIIGSTKVVVVVMVFMAVLLFVVDMTFMLGFNAIGVLKGGGLGVLFGGD